MEKIILAHSTFNNFQTMYPTLIGQHEDGQHVELQPQYNSTVNLLKSGIDEHVRSKKDLNLFHELLIQILKLKDELKNFSQEIEKTEEDISFYDKSTNKTLLEHIVNKLGILGNATISIKNVDIKYSKAIEDFFKKLDKNKRKKKIIDTGIIMLDILFKQVENETNILMNKMYKGVND